MFNNGIFLHPRFDRNEVSDLMFISSQYTQKNILLTSNISF